LWGWGKEEGEDEEEEVHKRNLRTAEEQSK
jgi:hypothetical protein